MSSLPCAHPVVTAFAATLLLSPCASHAAPLDLAQSPATLSREPAPNIIVSVDDSASMGAAGIATLKAALRETFSATHVADNRVRLAWQSMNRCRGIPSNSANCQNQNGMARLGETHRSNFMRWVDSLIPSNFMPSHLLMDEAGQYLSRTNLGRASPWAYNPGVQEAPVLSCRKSFHIFMTDGAWNTAREAPAAVDAGGADGRRIVRGGNADATSITLPDGMKYDAASAQTRIYSDKWGGPQLSTLSDLAFYYWSRDLQPGMPNNVLPSPKTPWPAQNFGTRSSPAELSSYWNPRNNPATWQHMVNYTIGFKDAASWTGDPAWGGDTFQNLGGLIDGTLKWPSPFCHSPTENSPCDAHELWDTRKNERKVELWHAALNSRGRFVPATSSSSLTDAFKGILDDILQQTVQPLVSIASSSSRLRDDGFVYMAGYDSTHWSGRLSAYAIGAGTLEIGRTPVWSAHTLLDEMDTKARNILTHNGSRGAAFQWDLLSPQQRQDLQGQETEATGRRHLAYLRGERGDEVSQPGGTLRHRDSRLGDIVNANLWQAGRPGRLGFEHPGHADFRNAHAGRKPVLYVGANDGMLHAFDAGNGRELMAYMPIGAYANLRNYTQPGYQHRYFVDGQAFTGDAELSDKGDAKAEPLWRTLLVGSLGGGGRGYFILDATHPLAATESASTFKPSGVVLDRTFAAAGLAADEAEKDIGHIYAHPVKAVGDSGRSEQIARLNNGRWAVVMGNGINSVHERPVLLIQYLDGPRELQRIVAHSATGQSNGLSAPRLLDINGDGKIDIAYAGDLQGNLWKFDLIHADATQWGVAAWAEGVAPCRGGTSCVPFFVARDGASPAHRQPITTAPIWMLHPLGGLQLLFGTGRNVEAIDPAETRVQTIYALWDKSTYTFAQGRQRLAQAMNRDPVTQGRSALVRQTVAGAVTSRASGTEVPTDYFTSSRNPVTYSRSDAGAPRGWYLDLPESRERVSSDPQLFEGQKVIVSTVAPALSTDEETCDFGRRSDSAWVNVLNMITGHPANAPVFSSADATMSLNSASRMKFGSGELVRMHSAKGNDLDLISLEPACSAADPACTGKTRLAAGNTLGKRGDWRELQ